MSTYNISSALNKNNVFLINLSELLGRLDPAYNIAIRNSDLRTKYPTEQIGKLVKSFSGGTPSKANPEFWEGNILWASPKDFKDFYLTDTEDRISESALSGSSTILAPADSLLIVVRSGVLIHTIPVAVAKLPMAINQDLKALIPDDRILPEYLGIYFRIYNDKLLPLIVKHSTTVQSINTEQFSKLKIPIPPKNIQQQIIAIYGEALQMRKQNEADTEKILASIDDYMLKELGITLPAPPKNILKKRMFTTSLSELSGSRFDPRYYQNYFVEFYKHINGKYLVKRLKEIAEYIGSGATPTAGGDAYTDAKDGVPFIRITNLKNDSIDLSDVLYIKREVHEKTLQRTKLKPDDLLLSMAGTIGLTVIVPDFIREANINQALARIILTNEYENIFVKEILNSKIGKIQTDRLSRPAVQANINFNEIGSLLIPNPPLTKQKEIAAHVTSIRQQAQQLKDKTKEALSKASQEIEKILLA